MIAGSKWVPSNGLLPGPSCGQAGDLLGLQRSPGDLDQMAKRIGMVQSLPCMQHTLHGHVLAKRRGNMGFAAVGLIAGCNLEEKAYYPHSHEANEYPAKPTKVHSGRQGLLVNPGRRESDWQGLPCCGSLHQREDEPTRRQSSEVFSGLYP